jgi:hypothetical protein
MHLNHPDFPVGFSFLPSREVHLQVGANGQYVGAAHMFSARIVSDEAHAMVDGNEAQADAAMAAGPRSDLPLILGVRGSELFPLMGDIAEVMIFDTALTHEQRTQVLKYLTDKYRLNSQAP